MTDVIYDTIVVGSGPAGVSAAAALLDGGRHVLLLDVGLQAEPPIEALKARLLNGSPKSWGEADLLKLKFGSGASAEGLSVKRSFGSDHMYQRPKALPQLHMTKSDFVPSYAEGGFSTVWGCSVLPYRDEDLLGWPIARADLESGYQFVNRHSHLVGDEDDLANEFGTRYELVNNFTSHPAQRSYERMQNNREALRRQGVRTGKSRILFNRIRQSSDSGCIRCGLCLYGCPKQVMFSTESWLAELRSKPHFELRSACAVRGFREAADHVEVDVFDLKSSATMKLKTKRLFIGAGVVSSAEIMMSSLPVGEVQAFDSQYFLQPILFWPGGGNVYRQELTAFAQIFLEVENRSLDPRNIHLQLYSFSPMLEEALQSKIPFPLSWIPSPVRGRLVGLLGVIQGYLHSDSSGHLRLAMSTDRKTMNVEGVAGKMTRAKVRSVVKFLTRQSLKTGFIPIPGSLQLTTPGRGFHVGGTFPMRAKPSGNESDIWGRIHGLNRVHLIDASVFATVPAATITYTVMANAVRIARGFLHEF